MTRTWQFNGVAPMREVLDWCKATLTRDGWQFNGWETITFHDSSDWVRFAMRWG